MKNLENMNLIYKVREAMSINDVLTKKLFISTRLKNKLIQSHNVLLNGTFVDTRTLAHPNDIITVVLSTMEDNSNIVPKQMQLDIIYEDCHILIINKPAGVCVHPSILHFDDSLSNGVKYYFDSINLHKKIRAVNRIDLNTSGLVLFAKNEYIQECLIKQMNSKLFTKTYLAIVSGHVKPKIGTINVPIARKENSIIERCVSSLGQPSVTNYKVIKEFESYSLVSCQLETGRTHQIRVHMAYIGNPLLGDSLYGSQKTLLINRQALHSYKMEFVHPVSNKLICVKCDLPLDMKSLLV